MEIILAIAIATAVTSHGLKNAVVDITWALRGQPSPRRRAAAARPRTRGAFASYWAELWRDSWTDAHARHSRRRERRVARPSRPQGAFRSYAGVVARDGWRRWDRAWDTAAERRMARPRPVDPSPAPVVVPADPTPASEPAPRGDEWHVTDRDGTQFITTADPQIHRDQGRTVRPVGKPGCPNCHGTGRWRDVPCTACQPVDPDHVWPDHPTDTHDDSYRSTPTTEGNTMTTTAPTGEVTGLSTAITNATAAAASAEAWPPALEQFSAGLAANEVGEGVLQLVAQAQEQFAMAAATMRDVEAALTKQRSVQEAYQANPDAGNKQFVTND